MIENKKRKAAETSNFAISCNFNPATPDIMNLSKDIIDVTAGPLFYHSLILSKSGCLSNFLKIRVLKINYFFVFSIRQDDASF